MSNSLPRVRIMARRLKNTCSRKKRSLQVVALLLFCWTLFVLIFSAHHAKLPGQERASASDAEKTLVLAMAVAMQASASLAPAEQMNFTLCGETSDCWGSQVCLQRLPLHSLVDHIEGVSPFDFAEARHKVSVGSSMGKVCIHQTELRSAVNFPRGNEGWERIKAFRRFKGLCQYKGDAGLPLHATAAVPHRLSGKQCVPRYGKGMQTRVLLDIPNVVLAAYGSKGSTPMQVASLYGIEAQSFAKLNNLTKEVDWYRPSAEERLYELPAETFAGREGRGRAIYHQVRPGETLTVIAERYSVTEVAVQLWNGIENPNTLSSGEVIIALPENYLQRVATPLVTNARRDVTMQLLRLFSDTAQALGIPWFVCGGTLLGFHRECDVLGWDLDVDVGMYIDDYSDDFMLALEARGTSLSIKYVRQP